MKVVSPIFGTREHQLNLEMEYRWLWLWEKQERLVVRESYVLLSVTWVALLAFVVQSFQLIH